MRKARIGRVDVSRLVIGGNPFSGFSHQSRDRDRQMREYFSDERICRTLADAEAAGINTVFARTDDHIMGVLGRYWRAGGTIQWFAQVVFDPAEPGVHRQWIRRAGELGAAGMYIHGGATDCWHANGQFDLFAEALGLMRDFGVPGGFAGHRPAAHAWVRDHLRPDFQMCSHYNPTDRTQDPRHSGVGEKWDLRDRAAMLEVVATLPWPAAHYKVFAGGNRPIEEAFETMARCVRGNDVVCIGVFPKDDAAMLARDIALFERHVEPATSASGR
jgi:hypothetical protein